MHKNKFINIYNKKNFYKIFLIIGFIISWASISSSYGDLFIVSSIDKIGFLTLINFLRSTSLLLYFIIILFCLFSFYWKTTFEFKNNFFFLFLCLYFIFQIPGLFLTENKIDNIYYIVSALNLLVVMHLASKIFDSKEIKIFMYIALFFLCFVFFVFFIKDLYAFMFTKPFSFYQNYDPNYLLFGEITPRSSGLSRSAIMIMIFTGLIITRDSKKSYLQYIITIFLTTVVILYQSRTSVTLILILCIMEIFILKKYSLKFISEKLIIYIIIPILLASTITILKKIKVERDEREMGIKIEILLQSKSTSSFIKNYYDNNSGKQLLDPTEESLKADELLKADQLLDPTEESLKADQLFEANKLYKQTDLNNMESMKHFLYTIPKDQLEKIMSNQNKLEGIDLIDQADLDTIELVIRKNMILRPYGGNLIREAPQNFSSNRFDDWKIVIKDILYNKKKKIFLLGYGAQGDRYLINQSASNAIIYALVSSGVIGVFFLLATLLCLVPQLINFILRIHEKDEHYKYFMIFTILLARSILESSYAVFGIDFMIFVLVATNLNYKSESKNA